MAEIETVTGPELPDIGRGLTDTDLLVGHDGNDLVKVTAARIKAYIGALDGEGVDDRVAALLKAGSGITLTYNDTTNELTASAAGGGGGGGGGAGTVIDSGAVGAGGVASINIASIPNTHSHLRLLLSLKASAGAPIWLVRPNGDGGAAKYRGQGFAVQGNGTFFNENAATVASLAHYMIAPSGNFASAEMVIYDYARTDRPKAATLEGTYFAAFAGANIAAVKQAAVFNDVAPIGSLEISLATGNIAEGSTWMLIGY